MGMILHYSLLNLFLFLQNDGLFMPKKSKLPFKIGTPERKILISLCYYVVVTAIALTALTLTTRNSEPFAAQLSDYFICKQSGQNPAALLSSVCFLESCVCAECDRVEDGLIAGDAVGGTRGGSPGLRVLVLLI